MSCRQGSTRRLLKPSTRSVSTAQWASASAAHGWEPRLGADEGDLGGGGGVFREWTGQVDWV